MSCFILGRKYSDSGLSAHGCLQNTWAPPDAREWIFSSAFPQNKTIDKTLNAGHFSNASVEFSRQEYWSGSCFLLQGIFPTQGSNAGLLHCRQILYQQSQLYQQREAFLMLQSCLTLCGPMDCSPPGSSVHGILQLRILEWVAMPSSRESSPPRDRTHVSCSSCISGRFCTAEPRGKPYT